jgi:hypothetical protein
MHTRCSRSHEQMESPIDDYQHPPNALDTMTWAIVSGHLDGQLIARDVVGRQGAPMPYVLEFPRPVYGAHSLCERERARYVVGTPAQGWAFREREAGYC